MQTIEVEDKISELRGLAQQVRDYQLERGWSDAKAASEISQIGSTKVYKRILDASDPLDEMSIENQIKGFRGALEFIEVRRKSDRFPEPEYSDFTNVVRGLAGIQKAFLEEGIARFVAIRGDSGTGKDAILHALQTRPHWSKVTVAIEPDEHCRHSLAEPQLKIVRQLNAVRSAQIVPRMYPTQVKQQIIDAIGDTRLVLVINEMHHMGPRGLNEVKSLINACPKLVIVGMFIPSLLRRLLGTSYDEAIQLFGNRLNNVVHLPSPPANEILLMLERRGVAIEDATLRDTVGKTLAEDAPQFGNWQFVVKFTRAARAICQKEPLTTETFAKALARARSLCLNNQVRTLNRGSV